MAKMTIGIMYDFDKTLCTTDMQNYAFIKNLGMEPDEFWNKASINTCLLYTYPSQRDRG